MPALMQRAGTEESYENASQQGPSLFSWRDASDLYFSFTGLDMPVIASRAPSRHTAELFLLALERDAFTQLAEASFAEDWDSEVDAVYDDDL